MRSSAITWTASLAAVLALIGAASAQAVLHGRVTDRSGGPLPKASVRVLAGPPRKLVATTKADDHGAFRLSELPPGSYSLDVASGMAFRARLIRVAAPAAGTVDFGDIWLDFDLRRTPNGLELQPAKRVEITTLDPSASHLVYGVAAIAIDGLAPGHDSWIRRPGCQASRIVLAAETALDLPALRVWRIGFK